MAALQANLVAEFRDLAAHSEVVLAHLGSPGLEIIAATEPLADAA
jgi:hypothetical protein